MKTLLHILVPWKMCLMGLLSGLLFFTAECLAQRNSLTPYDFQPLTSLPWKDTPAAPMEKILEKIYLEPLSPIRWTMLAHYLEEIPVEKLAAAFDCCVKLEGTQWPDELVVIFLPIWAKRDPQGAWRRLHELTGVMTARRFSWLGLDSWQNRKIEVRHRATFQRSHFWVGLGLEDFPSKIADASLPDAEKWLALKTYSARYLDLRGLSWMIEPSPQALDHLKDGVAQSFQQAAESAAARGDGLDFEVSLRRWLVKFPSQAPAIVEFAVDMDLRPANEAPASRVSDAFLLLWSRLDRPGMMQWAESLSFPADLLALRSRGLLMSQVDAPTRERWLAQARNARNKDDDPLKDLLFEWAAWDPKAAIAVALDFSQTFFDPEEKCFFVGDVLDGSVSPRQWALSSFHHALGVIRDLDLSNLPEETRRLLAEQFLYQVMETWGEVDAAEAARYGLKILLSSNYCPREQLLRFFSGDDSDLAGEDGMVDRTFCALRTWAMTQPNDMKAWIATVKEEDMRQALTWLLENPWGTGEE